MHRTDRETRGYTQSRERTREMERAHAARAAALALIATETNATPAPHAAAQAEAAANTFQAVAPSCAPTTPREPIDSATQSGQATPQGPPPSAPPYSALHGQHGDVSSHDRSSHQVMSPRRFRLGDSTAAYRGDWNANVTAVSQPRDTAHANVITKQQTRDASSNGGEPTPCDQSLPTGHKSDVDVVDKDDRRLPAGLRAPGAGARRPPPRAGQQRHPLHLLE